MSTTNMHIPVFNSSLDITRESSIVPSLLLEERCSCYENWFNSLSPPMGSSPITTSSSSNQSSPLSSWLVPAPSNFLLMASSISLVLEVLVLPLVLHTTAEWELVDVVPIDFGVGRLMLDCSAAVLCRRNISTRWDNALQLFLFTLIVSSSSVCRFWDTYSTRLISRPKPYGQCNGEACNYKYIHSLPSPVHQTAFHLSNWMEAT